MLITELERALLRDDEAADSELILQELRRTIREAAQPMPRIGDAARRFFVPLEPFLTDGPTGHKRLGRLARSSLEPIWEWISRDLMPAEATALSEDIKRALLAQDQLRVEQLVRALHGRAIERMSGALAGVQPNDKDRRRFSVQVGTPRAIEDVTTLVRVLAFRDLLAELARRLPDHIRTFDRAEIDRAMALFDTTWAENLPGDSRSQRGELLLYGLILFASRLAAPWQLIGIATRAAESDDAARIAATPYAVAVGIVLGELEHMLGELRAELKAGRPVGGLLKGLHDASRQFRTEINLSVDSAWSRQLAAIRSAASNLLTAEIETVPGRVRRLLRPPPAKEIVAGSRLDDIDVHEVAMRVELVGACRLYAGELAVSEVTLRTYSDLTQYLETGSKILLDALRHAEDAECPFRRSQAEAAIRLCRIVFGADYAGLLTKAAEVARQSAVVERKAARA
ncbi:MAG: hypothetical protein WBF58_19575 [Xanthobacteraceae bacterium]